MLTDLFTISASAFDANSGIYQVLFYIDDQLIAADSAGPYQVSIDPTAFGSGSHTIMAIAIDRAYTYSIVGISVTLENR